MMLKFIFSIIFASFLNKTIFILANELSSLTIPSVPKFPIFPNTPFEITINPTSNGKLVNYQTDTLIIRITDENDNELEKSIFVYGKDSFVFQQRFGKFIHINSLKKNIYQQFLNLVLSFPLEANNKFIEIYQISTLSKESYLNVLKNLKLANLLYLTKILLVIPPKIELYIKSNNGKANEFSPGEVVTITCQSTGESPFWKVNFVSSNNFTIISRRYIEENNKLQMKVNLKKEDHLEKVKCQTGNITKEIQIKILHFPTNVNLTRNDDVSLKFNESILCGAGNGYPIPKSFWKFVSGPMNSSLFYKISINKMHLTFTKKPFEETEWLFNCSASNKINSSNGVYNETVKFIITGKYIFIIDNDKINRKVALQRILLKKDISQIISQYKPISNSENQKSKEINKLVKQIFEIKKLLSQTTIEIDKLKNFRSREIENLKSKTENIKNDISMKFQDLSTLTSNHNKLQNDVVKQNDDISGLKIKMETLKTDLNLQTIRFLKIAHFIKNLTSVDERILAQLVFIKHNLYLIAPFNWIVSNIDFEDDEKREASSNPFYSPIKGIKMFLHLSATKDEIQIIVHFPVFLRNNLYKWPFNCRISIIIVHQTFNSIKNTQTKSFQIQNHPSITEPFKFNKAELKRNGLINEDSISLICDITEL